MTTINQAAINSALFDVIEAAAASDTALLDCANAFIAEGFPTIEKTGEAMDAFNVGYFTAWICQKDLLGDVADNLAKALAVKGAAWKKLAPEMSVEVCALRESGLDARNSALQKVRGHMEAISLGIDYAQLLRDRAANRSAPKGARTPAGAQGAGAPDATGEAGKVLTLQNAYDLLAMALSNNAPKLKNSKKLFDCLEAVAAALGLEASDSGEEVDEVPVEPAAPKETRTRAK
jgi:hypothetical protein